MSDKIDIASRPRYISCMVKKIDTIDEGRLHYRRQFLLCRENMPSLSNWDFLQLTDQLHLYTHPDLQATYHEQNGIKVVLLGYIFDATSTTKSDDEILADIAKKAETFDSLLEAIKAYAGQYIFIYINGQTIKVIHDPLALREVYYCTSINKVICGSQPNLIKEYSFPPLAITTDQAIQTFYNHDIKKIRSGRFWVGDETYYSGIAHLLPNHYLDICDLKPKRYWPRESLVKIDLKEAVRRSCLFLQGMLKAAAHRHELMMAVTGGTDSRTLLAASKEISGDIYYFINKHKSLTAGHPDIRIPSAIFKRIGIPFHIHELEGEIDDKFTKIFINNTFMSTDLSISAIYNIYYKQHRHRLNILGVGEIGRTFFGDEPRNIDGFYLARSMKIKNSPYAVAQCQKWLASTLPYARQYGVNIMTLLLWEQLLGNWGAVGNSESDIAIEEFDPFNSHYLYETLLGVDKKYAKYGEGIIFREMIKSMWPELLDYPINPPHKKADYIRLILNRTGTFKLTKSMAYTLDRLKFKLLSGRNS